MSVELESAARLNALKQGIEAKTGETYPDLTDGVNALIAGFGQGGGGDSVGDGTAVFLHELVITEPVHKISIDFPRDWDIYDGIFVVPISVISSKADWLYLGVYVGDKKKGEVYFGTNGAEALSEWNPQHVEFMLFKQDGIWYTFANTGRIRRMVGDVDRMTFRLYESGVTLNTGKFVFYGVKYEN